MDLALLCDPGCEAFCAKDVERIIGRAGTPGKGAVFVASATPKEVALLNYHLLTASRVLAVVASGNTLDTKRVVAADLSPYRAPDATFKVVARQDGERAHEVEEELGAALHGQGLPVDLTTPDMTVVVWQREESCVVGIDLTGRDLGKREYRAFHTRKSVRSTVVASALFAAGAVGQSLVDPFGTDGTLAIEAVLASTRTSPQLFRKEFSFLRMPFAAGTDWAACFREEEKRRTAETEVTAFYPLVRLLKMGRANAKLAGVDKLLTQTKCELRWFSSKLNSTVERVVAMPPVSSKHVEQRAVAQEQEELFSEAVRALTPQGRLVLLSEKKAELLNPAQRHGFVLRNEWRVRRGGAEFFVLSFARP